MPPRSLFDRHFSRAEQEKLAAYYRERPDHSTEDVQQLLAERGLNVGRTTAHKIKARLTRMDERLRRSQEIKRALIANVEEQDASEQTRALIEGVSTLSFEFIEAQLNSEDGALAPKQLMELSRSADYLLSALRRSQDFVIKNRETLTRELDRKFDDAEEAAEKGGDPMEVIRRVRREVYGILDD